MTATRKRQDERTRAIYDALIQCFSGANRPIEEVVYVYNPVAIRVRVIDDVFRGKSSSQRHRIVMQALSDLPERVIGDIMMLLALTQEEVDKSKSLVNLEFDDPSLSRL